jgi:hypothetical protein
MVRDVFKGAVLHACRDRKFMRRSRNQIPKPHEVTTRIATIPASTPIKARKPNGPRCPPFDFNRRITFFSYRQARWGSRILRFSLTELIEMGQGPF